MNPRVISGALIAAIAIAVPAMAQQPAGPSLAEIARQAEAAKATIKKAKKSYTNADLGANALPPPPPAAEPATGYVSKTLDKPVSAEEMLQRSEKQVEEQQQASVPTEAKWRARAERIRGQVSQAQERLAKLLGRPENPNANLQKKTEQDIARIQAGFDDLRKQWTLLEEDARAAKISLNWIEPAPQFPQ